MKSPKQTQYFSPQYSPPFSSTSLQSKATSPQIKKTVRKAMIKPEVDQLFEKLKLETAKRKGNKFYHNGSHPVSHYLIDSSSSQSNSFLVQDNLRKSCIVEISNSSSIKQCPSPKDMRKKIHSQIQDPNPQTPKTKHTQEEFKGYSSPRGHKKNFQTQSTLPQESRVRTLSNLDYYYPPQMRISTGFEHKISGLTSRTRAISSMGQKHEKTMEEYNDRYYKELVRLRFEERDYLLDEFEKRMQEQNAFKKK